MQKRFLYVLLVWLLLPATVLADLSGTWEGDDGGTYYLRQDGALLYWYGEQQASKPEWSNVFHGRVRYDYVSGDWMDVPKGGTTGRGRLTLLVKEGGNALEVSYKSGGLKATHWVRKGFQSTVGSRKEGRVRTAPGSAYAENGSGERVVRSHLSKTRYLDECIDLDLRKIDLKKISGRWKVVEQNQSLFDFGADWDDAWSAYRIIHFYRADQLCSVGRGKLAMEYLLTEGVAPRGRLAGENCQPINHQALAVTEKGGDWHLNDGEAIAVAFGAEQRVAEQALALLLRHNFSHVCRAAGKTESFGYFRR